MYDLIQNIGLLFYPLLALSVLGAVLTIERFMFFIRLPKIETSDNLKALSAELSENAHLAKSVRDELLSFRLSQIHEKMMYGIHMLRIIAVISPMLGLLGTVLGMINAFKDIAGQTGPVVPSMIADGLWSAMLTTAYGLLIALPCLFAAFVYARMAEKRIGQIQNDLNIQSLKLEGVKLS